MRTHRLLLVFIVALFSACTGRVSDENSTKARKAAEALDELVTDNKVPGISFSLVDSTGSVLSVTSGYADIEYKREMKVTDRMFSGSIGKTYAAAIMLQLLDEGEVDLGDKYMSYFDDLEWIDSIPGINDISIEMLLRHTSGLPRWVMKQAVWDAVSENPDKIWSYYDRLSLIFGENSVHPPGKGWSYSDTNYILLGMLIEKLCGMNYYEVLDERILTPGLLKNTIPADHRNIDKLASGYSALPEMFMMPGKVVDNGVYVFNPQMEWTGGGVVSTTEDLAVWCMQYYGQGLFSDSLKNMIVSPGEYSSETAPGTGYGMGSFIFETAHGVAYGHTGFVPGFVSVFAYYPEKRLAAALQVNCDYATREMSLISYIDYILDKINEE